MEQVYFYRSYSVAQETQKNWFHKWQFPNVIRLNRWNSDHKIESFCGVCRTKHHFTIAVITRSDHYVQLVSKPGALPGGSVTTHQHGVTKESIRQKDEWQSSGLWCLINPKPVYPSVSSRRKPSTGGSIFLLGVHKRCPAITGLLWRPRRWWDRQRLRWKHS